MRRKRLLFGARGQDGSYLSQLLVSKGYEVHGMIRRNSVAENQDDRLRKRGIGDSINTFYGDVTDVSTINNAISRIMPDQVYNLAAQSHVRISFDLPLFTAQVNAVGVINILESLKNICPMARFYQASSSEMFGNSVDRDAKQRQTTPMSPVSPYGCAKVFGYNITRHYRNAHKMFASNGILFNHESPRRGTNFVTNKVVKTAVMIKKGLADKLVLGNMDSKRDWGHSKDYVRAMYMIMHHDEPDDFVVATGQTKSVRQLCEYVFDRLEMDYRDYVSQDEKYVRPEQLKYLCGDSTKIRNILGWRPQYTFETLLDEMIQNWMGVL